MSEKVYQLITDRIIKTLEAGTIPWRKPWSGSSGSMNLISKKEYRGVNRFLTDCAPFSSKYWLTFKQAKQLGGQVKKGSKSTPVIYWNMIKKQDSKTGKEKTIPFLRYYNVFNVEQTTVEAPEESGPTIDFQPIEKAESIVQGYKDSPEIEFKEQAAFYRPANDSINMPKPETFTSPEEYYSTLFHEMTHSTGHESRLKREGITNLNFFGSHSYSKEELVAEMGAAFLCSECKIEQKILDNSAAYIQSWLRKLRNDNKLLISASGQAEKAAKHILGN
jgi:antirestriction protein ArdC